MVKTYNTLPLPFPSGSEERRPTTAPTSAKSHPHLFQTLPAETDDSDLPIRSPYTPVDYKILAMEMAYLTPRRKGIFSVRSMGSAYGGSGGLGPSFSRMDSQGSTRSTMGASGTQEQDMLLAIENNGTVSPRPMIVHRQNSSTRTFATSSSMSSSADTAASPGKLSLILFAASILFLFADQNLLAPNLTAVAHDFGFDDAQRDIKLGGQIPFAFFVVGGAVSVVVGPLADVMNRKNLYVWTCLVGTIPCILTYWVQTFNQFFVLRTLTGVAVGGAFPLIYSLAADITTPDQRALASSLITISMGLGSTLGQGVAGFVGPTYGWRLPFVIIAIPSILVISLVVLTMKEPPRSTGHQQQHEQQIEGDARIIQVEEAGMLGAGGEDGWEEVEEEEEKERGPSLARLRAGACMVQLRKFLDVFIVRTNLLAFCQSMPGCLPWGVISAFLTDYLHEQRGMTVESATSLMFVFGLGCFAGNLAGGILGQWVYNRSKEAAAVLMAATTALGFLPMAWLINANSDTISTPGGGFTLIAAVVAFSGGIAAFTGPLVRAFVMQVNSSRNRGTVFSVFMVADDLGKGLGPAIVSLLIPEWGRLTAFNISLGGWILCAVFLGLLAFTIRPDEEALLEQLAEEARQIQMRQNKQQQQQQQGVLSSPVVTRVNGVQSVHI